MVYGEKNMKIATINSLDVLWNVFLSNKIKFKSKIMLWTITRLYLLMIIFDGKENCDIFNDALWMLSKFK